jgi:SNF2 family DNA or RNA helicase
VKYVPHEYQKTAIKWMAGHGSAALFQDPGMGKTSETYAAFKLLRQAGMVKRMLIIAPLRPAHSVWPAEARKWDDFKDLNVHVLHGPNKLTLLDQPHDVSVINPEGLEWLFQQMKLRGWWWDMLVVDESTKFKHSNTKRFKTLKSFLPRFKRRYILTGSPAPNGLLDLFGQIYILDLGHSLGKFVTHYRTSYFDSVGFGGFTWVPRAGAAEVITEKLKPLVLRMAGSDYLKLPPLINNTVKIELPDKARKIYDQMEALLLATIEDQIITAASSGAATMKCRQIANGGIYHEGAKAWEHVHNAKTEAVQDLVEELGGKPALIAYEFRHDLARLQAAFPDAPYLGGGITTKQSSDVQAAWNAGILPVLLAQPQSVAHGLNLQGVGSAVIWHSLTWDLELYEQFVRRVWRQGQRDRIVCHHIVATNTVDEVIMAGVGAKDRTQQALLNALKAYLKA